ncbi:MAG: phosphopantothenate/pantothenate synthetase [Euryarchaeota archaeon]|nr:phosphopantothenate/pantothenate synthetase [Euryarchaeota archaeon]DAC23671.1 MAG TPA: phosphopantothenate/pantothenate synthetase [Candidatus Poseidoniales archaeon]HII86392.1 phosphopantothenate/pantothenate synthetase [Candidatus Poseidoniaceae archaeon]
MSDFAADPSHPRYQSLRLRHRLEEAEKQGMLAGSAMIAHGRGEAYDYLLGEQTIPSAHEATLHALRALKNAEHPIISLNGNAVALAGEQLLALAQQLNCPVEINIFYRTPERMSALLERLETIKKERSLDVEILGASPNARIPGLKGPRAKCTKEGIIDSDVILVPLEDGDRCEALVAMGKTVIVIDLNPLSRSAKMGTITIVDELTRVAENMLFQFDSIKMSEVSKTYDNEAALRDALRHIATKFSD